MVISNTSEILKLLRLPGRINADQAAALLGFQLHDIPVLVAAKLIQPLGKPNQAAPKWFSSVEVESLRQNPEFLAKATRAVALRWQKRNARVKKPELLDQAA